jgi:26S proteasome regulatory subunit N11
MLLNLHKKNWTEGLRLKDWQQMKASNEESIKVRIIVPPLCSSSHTYLLSLPQRMLQLAQAYTESVQEEATMTPQQLKTRHVGKQDPKRHLEEAVETAMGDSIVQSLGTMMSLGAL